ncbi:ABC transporter permease [Clostridia bacterium]|nr:ABC transporter permease [Clostridia bacterium]
MLGKLIKYDLRFGAKQYAFVGAITAALILLMGFGRVTNQEWMTVLFMVLAVMATVALLVLYVVISVRHMYTQMCGNESIMGYTLPVSPHSLLLSKLISMLIWAVATVGAVILFWWLAVDLMFLRPEGESLKDVFGFAMDQLAQLGIEITSGAWLGFGVTFVVGYLQFITALALCTAIANIPALKERGSGVVVAVLCFLFGGQIINTASTWIYGLVTKTATGGVFGFNFDTPESQVIETISNLMVFQCVSAAVQCVIFYFLAVWIMDRKRSI